MTREEEIKLVASCHIAASNEDFKEYYEGFIAGAKWADKTMIDKACDEQFEGELAQCVSTHEGVLDINMLQTIQHTINS